MPSVALRDRYQFGYQAGLLIGVPAFLAWNAELPWWILLVAAGLAGFIVRWLVGSALKSWRLSNWLMWIAPDGLWVNIRSYLNRDFPPARTVAHLPYDEIAAVKVHISKRAEQTNDGTTAWTERYLDIQLINPVPNEVRAKLAEERHRQVTQSHVGGLVTSRSRYGHSPVTVASDNLIRVAWRGRYDWVTPSLRRTLRELQRRVAVGESTQADFSNWKALTNEQVDSLTLQLVESGDTIGAIKLLTDRRGYSTTAAHRFIEELTAAL